MDADNSPKTLKTEVPVDAPERNDRFGFTEVFQTHLEVSLVNMHPEQAVAAACFAVQQYAKSYSYRPLSTKDQQGPTRYQMFQKRESSDRATTLRG